jgi:hypothetical protein
VTRYRVAGVLAGVFVVGLSAGKARADAPSNPPAPTPAAPAAPAPAGTPAAPAPAAGQADGKATTAAPDPKDAIIEQLLKTVDDLKKRVEDLEKRPAPPANPPDQPPVTPPPPDNSAPKGAGATYIPNISAIGNIQFHGGDKRHIGNRGQFNFDEFEIGLQDAVTPSLRYDVFLSAEKGEDWKLGMEEGYLTATRLAEHLTARIGRIRIPFGKENPTHPHARLYIDQPAVMTAFFGPDGLIGDGAVAEYLLPTGPKLFARAELGHWQTDNDVDDGSGFRGGRGEGGAWSGRLYFGKEVGKDKELELGFSRYSARGQVATGIGPSRPLAVNGVDLTYRSYPGQDRRFLAQAELLTHSTGDEFAGAHTRIGGYLLAAYRLNRFYEGGIRADYTQYPFPTPGYEAAGHLFLTKFITEQTSIRLQLTHGRAPGFTSGYNEIMFQILFGSGPHTHPLQ